MTKNNIAKRKYRILGIDPGSRIAGYAVIDSYKNKMDLIDFGTVKLQSDFDGEKLHQLSEFLIKIIESFRPDMIAVEKVFMGKNVLSALKLGQVRGVILLTAQKFTNDFKLFQNDIFSDGIKILGQRIPRPRCEKMARLGYQRPCGPPVS